MRRYKVVILESVEQIIRQNYAYITETFENEVAAYAHTADIYQKIQSLSTFPNSYPVYEDYPGQKFRVMRVRQYRIFYQVDDEHGIVYIVDIMHSHQDPDSSLQHYR